jgi:glycine betaine/proline transport system ATP-binding protein
MEEKVKISVRNLYKVFGPNPKDAIKMVSQGKSKEDILAKTKSAVGVSNASFDVYEGETLVVMGLSGSGKSTLLRCVNRLHEPTQGEILIDGVDIAKLSHEEVLSLRAKKFGMVFQNFALFPHRTVLANTEYGLEIQRIAPEERKKRAMEALELVGLKGWEHYYPRNLSGGMQQRVGLARALAVEPDILLMDEAFSALDPLIRTEMQDELLSLETKVKKTILFITHDLDEALKMGDRIILMKDGKIVQIGTSEDILSRPATEYVEKFVENVDITKVLTAKDVMIKAAFIYSKDGPRIALRKMKEIGIPRILVVNKDKELIGMVMAEDAANAIEKGEKDIKPILNHEYKTVTPDMPLTELLPLVVDVKHPIVVLDEDKKLIGIIVNSSILATLAERGRGGE